MDENEKRIKVIKEELPQYTKPTLIVEGSYSNIFFGIRVGGGCSSGCSRHMPEM